MFMLKIFLMLLVSHGLQAELSWKTTQDQFSIEIVLSSDKIDLLNSLNITAALKYPTTYSIEVEKLTQNLLKHSPLTTASFSVLSQDQQKVSSGDFYEHTVTWILKPLKIGLFPVSLFDILFEPISGNAKPVSIFTQIFYLNVAPVKMAAPSLNYKSVLPLTLAYPVEIDIENSQNLITNETLESQEADRNLAIFRQKKLPWLVLLSIPLLILVVWMLRFDKTDTRELKRQTARSKALKEVRQLQEMKADMGAQPFFFKLDQILREYAEDRYRFKAVSSTQEEFISDIQQHFPTNTQQQEMIAFIKRSEVIKFAHQIPTQADYDHAIKTALMFISD